MERNIQEQRRYDDEEAASTKSETKKLNGMRIEEADKKLRSILYLALGNEGKRIFGQKFKGKKTLKFIQRVLVTLSYRFRQENERHIGKANVIEQETTRQRVTSTTLGSLSRNG